jgi:hypothetical protein
MAYTGDLQAWTVPTSAARSQLQRGWREPAGKAAEHVLRPLRRGDGSRPGNGRARGQPGLARPPRKRDSADPQGGCPRCPDRRQAVEPEWRLEQSGRATERALDPGCHRRIRGFRRTTRVRSAVRGGLPRLPEPGRRATRWARRGRRRRAGRRRGARRRSHSGAACLRGPAVRVGPGSRLDPRSRRTTGRGKVVPRQRQSQRTRKALPRAASRIADHRSGPAGRPRSPRPASAGASRPCQGLEPRQGSGAR